MLGEENVLKKSYVRQVECFHSYEWIYIYLTIVIIRQSELIHITYRFLMKNLFLKLM